MSDAISATVVQPSTAEEFLAKEKAQDQVLTVGKVPANYAGYFQLAKLDFSAFLGKLSDIPHLNRDAIMAKAAEIEKLF